MTTGTQADGSIEARKLRQPAPRYLRLSRIRTQVPMDHVLGVASGAAHTALILHAGARKAEGRSQTTSRQRAHAAGNPLQNDHEMRIPSTLPPIPSPSTSLIPPESPIQLRRAAPSPSAPNPIRVSSIEKP